MFGMISNFRNLYVADYFMNDEMAVKIVFSRSTNFIVDKDIIYPFATDVETDTSVLVTSNNHVRKLNYYVNRFGFSKKKIMESEKLKQELVVDEVKYLKRLRKI